MSVTIARIIGTMQALRERGELPDALTDALHAYEQAQRGRHARPVYDLDAIPEDPALATEPECCT